MLVFKAWPEIKLPINYVQTMATILLHVQFIILSIAIFGLYAYKISFAV